MDKKLNLSVLRATRIMEALYEDGFEGKNLKEISRTTDIPLTTAWRLLKTLESEGWVIEMPVVGSKQGRWKVSTKLAAIADAYEQHALAQIQGVKWEFKQVTGRELSA